MAPVRVGFHASHEQLPPSALLRAVRAAEEAGFTAAMCSDHLAPWSRRQGHSGFAWSWLGAALAVTSLPMGVVTAPVQRYHPAVIAQAAATLAEMFPGRFWMAAGSGEALNEHVTGDRWPPKAERNARLREAVDVIRALLAGEEVTCAGRIRVDRARIYSLPAEPPPIVAAAVSARTARWAGAWADGLITTNQPPARLREVIEAFRDGGGGGRPVRVQVHLSYDPDPGRALAIAHDQWREPAIGGGLAWDLETPEAFEQAARFVRPEDVREHVLVSADLARHAEWLNEIAATGADELHLHHVGKGQDSFIEAFGARVLPGLATDG